MKTLQDTYQKYGPRVGSTSPSIEALQIDPMWRLFPVQPQNRLASAKTRIQEATADTAQLRRWESELPGWNWGLATGALSGVFVLEADTTRASSILQALCEDDWSWRDTLLMNFGNRGFAFFQWPTGRAMRSSATLGPGVKIHGEGDWVQVASHAYLDPEATIAAPPQWLIDSGFADLEEESSGRTLVFPRLPSREASTTARPTGLCAKLLPFAAQDGLSDPRHRVYVYMAFQFSRGRWHVQFMEKDLQTVLPRTLTLATAEDVMALAGRGGGLENLGGRQALDLAIANRRGGILLALTTDQYSQLQLHCRPNAGSSAGRAASSLTARLQIPVARLI